MDNSKSIIPPDREPGEGKRIGTKEKLAYFSVNIGNIPIMTLIGSFLLIFYTDVVGLDPGAVATLFLVTRVLDGLNDPLMGYIIDHLPRTRWGRFRPYIILGTLICGINYLALWLGPSLATSGKLIIAYVSYVFIGITFDLMDVPLNSLIPVMSTNIRDRDSLSIIKSLGYGIGAVLFTAPIVPLIMLFGTQQEGYNFVIIIAVTFVIVASIIGTIGVKERVEPATKERYKVKDLLKMLTFKPVIGLFITVLVVNIATSVATSVTIFYFTYVCGDAGLMSPFTIVQVLFAASGFLLAIYLFRRLGNKRIFITGIITSVIPMAIVLFIPPSAIMLLMVILGVSRIGIGFTSIVSYAMQADVMDYIDWKMGIRSEGAIASLFSFIVKAAMGIGGAIPGYILATTGYVPNQPQSASALSGITFLFLGMPVIAALIALVLIVLLYPIDSRMNKEIQAELARRRARLTSEK
jgi:sugar (glycoside-pentoside-hexuronide) transporter